MTLLLGKPSDSQPFVDDPATLALTCSRWARVRLAGGIVTAKRARTDAVA